MLPPKPPALDVPTFRSPAEPSPEPPVPGALQLATDADFWTLYEEVSTLGRGSFGEVKLVRLRSTGGLVAVKAVAKSGASASDSYGGITPQNEPQLLMAYQQASDRRKFDSAPARIGGRRKQRMGMTPQPSLTELQDALRVPEASKTRSPLRTPPLSRKAARPQTLPGRGGRKQKGRDRGNTDSMSIWELQAALGGLPGDATSEAEAAPSSAGGVPSLSSSSSAGVFQLPSSLAADPPRPSPLAKIASDEAPAGSSGSTDLQGAFIAVDEEDDDVDADDDVAEAERRQSEDAVRLLEVYESPATLFMVMRAELGGDLESRLASLPGGVFDEAEARDHTAAVLRALDGMHAQRVVHRDVKLGNVLLNERAEGRLGDFGLAERLPDDVVAPDDEGGTRPGLLTSVCGTHDCMAPEMVRCGHGEAAGYGTAVDMWALGVMVFTMLFGRHPFERPTEIATLTAILAADAPFPPAPAGRPAVSAAAKDLIRRLLAPDPDRRATAAEALRHAWIRGAELSPRSDGEASSGLSSPPPSLSPPPPSSSSLSGAEEGPAPASATTADSSPASTPRQISRLWQRPSVVKSAMSIALGRQTVGHT